MSAPGIEVEHITVCAGEHVILNDLSTVLKGGELIGIIGPSGSGKSIFLKVLAGIFPCAAGTVNGVAERRSLMFQEGALFDSFSVLDNVAFPLVHGMVPLTSLPAALHREVRDQGMAMLARVGLDWAWSKMPGELSGGMRKRVSLARALVTSPELCLLDDPTSGLDPVASSVIMSLIAELQEEYKSTVIVVSHDLRRLLPVVDHVSALFSGQIVWSGSLESLSVPIGDMDSAEHGSLSREQVRKFVQCRFDLDAVM